MSTIGQVINIKVNSFLSGNVDSFDVGSIMLRESGTNQDWLFFIWNSRDAEAPVKRVLQSQRLALLREAAFRNLTIEVFHRNDSSLMDGFQVNLV